MTAADLGLPAGVRAFDPEAAARLQSVARRLEEVFRSYGYRRVVVPTIERTDVVARGLGPEARARLFNCVEPGTGEVVALCPDHTAQIARLWAASLHEAPRPVRVSYVGPVMRAWEERAGRPREVYQAGVECLGAEGTLADAEVVAVGVRALRSAGVAAPSVDLGHAGFLGAILDAAALAEPDRLEARTLLARKDAPGLDALLAAAGRAPRGAAAARRALPRLSELYGAGALGRSRRLARRLGVGEAALDELESVSEALAAADPSAAITLDPGEARGFGYYTGLTVEIVAPGAGGALGVGGRYDRLLGRYGRDAPAVGLGLDLGHLLEAVEGETEGTGGLLLAAGGLPIPDALRIAERLRDAGHRVTVLPHVRRAAEARAHQQDGVEHDVLVPGRGGRWRRVSSDGTSRPVALESLY